MRRTAIAAIFLGLLASIPLMAQTKLSSDEVVDTLRGFDQTIEINAPVLYQRALARIKARQNDAPVGRPSIADELTKLPQLTVEIQFDFDSAIIKPQSYRTLGRIADALWHPYLVDYRFLVVGHTDATGKREYNLALSQRRANAIREALTTTFRVPPRRVIALGLGEEQLQDAADPKAAVNRRVQMIAIGKL